VALGLWGERAILSLCALHWIIVYGNWDIYLLDIQTVGDTRIK
jgi:hypothetical protein